jgi:hypothetical protein
VGFSRAASRRGRQSRKSLSSNLGVSCQRPVQRRCQGDGALSPLAEAQSLDWLANQLDADHHAKHDALRDVELVLVVNDRKIDASIGKTGSCNPISRT